ncbi:MAG TPA: XRE family transcriptional regulator [Tepidisphaeraceae bacterium]|jgi:phage repressor protein C with HTH and peptisase S24 domain/DNA-binding XRE family transcriptional regulator
MDSLGTKLRRQRRRLGFTLDELAAKTSISKPYLSLIETGRVPNPPSDEKLKKLEQVLGFPTNELLTQAHLQRTPRDVRAVLAKLIQKKGSGLISETPDTASTIARTQRVRGTSATNSAPTLEDAPVNLDDIFLSGVLQELVEHTAGNVEQVGTNAVPVINRVSAGYPRDFTDLSYPKGVADDYVSCPDLQDRDAFAARVHGDSMMPKYRQGDIVIFSPSASPKNGDDCFVRFADGQTTFKRVFFETEDGGGAVIRLQPRNERYRPQTVSSEQITGLYKALFRYQRVDED